MKTKPRAPAARGSTYYGHAANDDAHDFSAEVESTKPIIVGRPAYFNNRGRTGGHDLVGVGSLDLFHPGSKLIYSNISRNNAIFPLTRAR